MSSARAGYAYRYAKRDGRDTTEAITNSRSRCGQAGAGSVPQFAVPIGVGVVTIVVAALVPLAAALSAYPFVA